MKRTRLARVSPRRAADGPPFSTLARGKKKLGRNKKRSAKNLERAHGPAARREWIKTLPCYYCGRRAGPYRSIVGAHIKNGGMSRKADADQTIPLCATPGLTGCHDKQHRKGWSVLPYLYDKDVRAECAAIIEQLWRQHLAEARP